MNNIGRMSAEVLEILKYLDKDDISKIPSKILNALEENKLPQEAGNIDPTKTLEEQDICNETFLCMLYLYKNYLGTSQGKTNIDNFSKGKYLDSFDIKKIFNIS